MGQSIENKILKRISDKKTGWVFTPSYFLDLGNRDAIDQALGRMVSGKVSGMVSGMVSGKVSGMVSGNFTTCKN